MVVDEPAVTIGNLYMKRESRKEEEMIFDNLTTVFKQVVRHAKKVFFIDAAFTPDVLKICEHVYGGHYEVNKKEIEKHMKNDDILKIMEKPCNYKGNQWLKRQKESGVSFKLVKKGR